MRRNLATRCGNSKENIDHPVKLAAKLTIKSGPLGPGRQCPKGDAGRPYSTFKATKLVANW
jgi:hypothetical protein